MTDKVCVILYTDIAVMPMAFAKSENHFQLSHLCRSAELVMATVSNEDGIDIGVTSYLTLSPHV